MKAALYVVGEPGSGKTTLVESLTAGWPRQEFDKPLGHVLFPEPGVVELGRRREGGFSGTDALSMSAITVAEPWVQDVFFPTDLLLAEGDRLAVDRFFQALLDGGWTLHVAWLDVPAYLAAERRAARAAAAGSELQKESWVAGRRTKVMNLVSRWEDHVVRIGNHSTELMIAELVEASPVAAALVRGATYQGATV